MGAASGGWVARGSIVGRRGRGDSPCRARAFSPALELSWEPQSQVDRDGQ